MKLIDRVMLTFDVIVMVVFAASFVLTPLYIWCTRPDGVMGEAEWTLSVALMLCFASLFILALGEYEDTRREIRDAKRGE